MPIAAADPTGRSGAAAIGMGILSSGAGTCEASAQISLGSIRIRSACGRGGERDDDGDDEERHWARRSKLSGGAAYARVSDSARGSAAAAAPRCA